MMSEKLNLVVALIAIISAMAGALGTYTLGRIERAAELKDRRELRAAVSQNARRAVLALQMSGNIYAKLNMAPRFSDELYKLLQLEAAEVENAGIDGNGSQE